MLPVKIKNTLLSDNASLRLADYYRNFCSGEAGARYGSGHLLFACYAAFPLLLSPDLLNYLWLNFKSYQDRTGARQIDRVAITDLLLSALVRPVAHRQFEMIPEVRSYLLQLFQDGSWFKLYGVDPAQLPQLSTLARFLESYTKDKSSSGETNAENFRELNQWAVLAYLAPAELSVRIGSQLAGALESDDDAKQLRLNVLIDRIGTQASLNPAAANRKGIAAFHNLRNYSQGNRARLFEEPEKQISEWYYQLGDAFLSDRSSPGQVLLPVTHSAGERLARRKEGRQRMFTLFAYAEDPDDYRRPDGLKAGRDFEEYLNRLPHNYNLLENEPFQALRVDSLDEVFFDALSRLFDAANPEDQILIYYRGSNKSDYNRKGYPPYSGREINPTTFQKRLLQLQGKGCKTILIMDTPELGYGRWLKSGIQINRQRTPDLRYAREVPEFSELLIQLIYQMGGQLTYADVVNLLPLFAAYQKEVEIAPPLLTDQSRMKDQQMFTNQRHVPHPDQSLIIYDPQAQIWRVVEEDFKMITRNVTTTVLTYDKKELKDVRGEIFIRDGLLSFGTNSKDMDKKQIYRIHPHKRKLAIDLQFSKGGLDGAGIYLKLRHIKRRGPMLWSSSPSFETNRNEDHLLEVHAEETKDSAITWYYNGRSGGEKMPRLHDIKWVTPATIAPDAFLSKFSAFEYLLQLQYPDWFPERRAMRVQIAGWWGKDGEDIPALMDEQLTVDPRSLMIAGGELRLKPLMIEISDDSELPLFFDVYLIGQDLSITKELRQNRIIYEQRRGFEFQNHAALERMILNDIPCYLKIVYSYKPINIDFSQEGLKDGRYTYA